MSHMTVFLITFSISLFVYSVIFAVYIAPWLAKLSVWDAMQVLLIPHLFHQVGLATMVNGIVGPEFPSRLAWTVAIGDLSVLFAALLAAIALHRHSSRAAGLLWLFTLIGASYNSYAGLQTYEHFREAVTGLGSHWYVGTVYVPLLLLSHVLVFYNLLRRGKELRVAGSGTRRRSRKLTRARAHTVGAVLF